MSKFKKGESGNPGGRPPGQSEKVKELRDKITKLVDSNFETLQSEFDKMNGKDKFHALDRLLKFVLPPPIGENILDSLSDADLDKLISYLRRQINE